MSKRLFQAWWMLVGIIVALAGSAYAGNDIVAFAILSPQPNAVISGDTFELAWRCDPDQVGTAVAICINHTIFASYNQNAAENHLTLKVPPAIANQPYTIGIYSYWQSTYNDPYNFHSHFYGEVRVSFTDSYDFLESSVVSGQSGTTFTVTWKGQPDLTGSALRFELWHKDVDADGSPSSEVQVLGYVWDFATTTGTFRCPMPRVDRASNYFVRIVSIYRELHDFSTSRKYADSSPFALNSLPYIQILNPTNGTQWKQGLTYHVLWVAEPLHFGTAARIELWRSGRFVMVLGSKWDCGENNDFALSCPPLESTTGYKIRVVSYWQEQHPTYAVSHDGFSNQFAAIANPVGRITYPPASTASDQKTVWERRADGKFMLNYESDLKYVGTAVRIDLWKSDKFFKTLGYNWNNQPANSLLLDDPRVPADADYYIRVVSYWQEEHPSPLTPVFFESATPVQIGSESPFRFSFLRNDYDGEALWLRMGWHAEWPFVGTTFRLELWPINPRIPNEHYVIEKPVSTGDDSYQSYLIPPIPCDETAYYVRLNSYWQEGIQGPYQSIQSQARIFIPNPRQQ